MTERSHPLASIAEMLGPDDVARAQPRVGRTPAERLEWAIRFAQADLAGLSRGDWLNHRLELTAFAEILVREHERHGPLRLPARRPGADSGSEPGIYSEAEVRELHAEFARIVARLLDSDAVTVGSYEVTLTVERWPLAPDSLGRPVRLRTTFPPGITRATHALAHLLGIHGHLVKQCPAPRARGAPDDRCRRWFLGRRPNQVYCGTRCQSRATTRASREAPRAPRGRDARGRRRGRVEGRRRPGVPKD